MPTRHRMTRIVCALIDQYKSNVKTNLTTHCWKRLEFFLHVLCYDWNSDMEKNGGFDMRFDKIDVRNTIKNLMLNENWIDDDADEQGAGPRKRKMDKLYGEVQIHCGPSFASHLTIQDYVEKEWFESLRLWICI